MKASPDNDDPILTTREAAHLLGVAVSTAQLWMESGALPAWKTPGGHRRVHLSAVNRLLAQQAGIVRAAAAAPPQGEFLPDPSPAYPVAPDEARRLAALGKTGLLDTPAEEVFDRITAPGFLANVTARGEELKSAIATALADHPRLREVRGAGLLVGAQFDVPVGALVQACREDGLLVITAGAGDVLRLVPPLIVTSAEIQKAATIVAKRAREVVV